MSSDYINFRRRCAVPVTAVTPTGLMEATMLVYGATADEYKRELDPELRDTCDVRDVRDNYRSKTDEYLRRTPKRRCETFSLRHYPWRKFMGAHELSDDTRNFLIAFCRTMANVVMEGLAHATMVNLDTGTDPLTMDQRRNAINQINRMKQAVTELGGTWRE